MFFGRYEIENILGDLKYKDWEFRLSGNDAGPLYLQVRFVAPNNTTGTLESWSGRKWCISCHMTKSEVVLTALKAVLTAEEHEAREQFLYRGKAIFGPHLDVDCLFEQAEKLDAREEKHASIS